LLLVHQGPLGQVLAPAVILRAGSVTFQSQAVSGNGCNRGGMQKVHPEQFATPTKGPALIASNPLPVIFDTLADRLHNATELLGTSLDNSSLANFAGDENPFCLVGQPMEDRDIGETGLLARANEFLCRAFAPVAVIIKDKKALVRLA
jgi:hypothetical protein